MPSVVAHEYETNCKNIRRASGTALLGIFLGLRRWRGLVCGLCSSQEGSVEIQERFTHRLHRLRLVLLVYQAQ